LYLGGEPTRLQAFVKRALRGTGDFSAPSLLIPAAPAQWLGGSALSNGLGAPTTSQLLLEDV
jgi:hypothetical protein